MPLVSAKRGAHWALARRQQQNWFIKNTPKEQQRSQVSVGNTRSTGCSHSPVPRSPSPPFPHSPLSQSWHCLLCRASILVEQPHFTGALESTGDLKRGMRCLTFKVRRENGWRGRASSLRNQYTPTLTCCLSGPSRLETGNDTDCSVSVSFSYHREAYRPGSTEGCLCKESQMKTMGRSAHTADPLKPLSAL